MRMKTLANLAADGPKKRRRGGDDDNFGADDADWGVYRTVATGGDQSEDEEEEDVNTSLKTIEAQLIEYDPDFTAEHTLAAQSDWTKSLVHAFLRGPWPFDAESQREAYQMHLNVERIRVPEVVFQPSIAGIDQAGIVEIAADIINQRFSAEEDRTRLLKDVFLTGGNTLFQGFDERLRTELRAVLPTDAKISVRRAADPLLDAWKGAAQWASGSHLAVSSISRQEYQEKGSEYLKVRYKLFACPCRLLISLTPNIGTRPRECDQHLISGCSFLLATFVLFRSHGSHIMYTILACNRTSTFHEDYGIGAWWQYAMGASRFYFGVTKASFFLVFNKCLSLYYKLFILDSAKSARGVEDLQLMG